MYNWPMWKIVVQLPKIVGMLELFIYWISLVELFDATPLWDKWRWDSHSQKWEFGVLQDSADSKLDYKGQNTLPWSVLYTVGKALKCRYRKWPLMNHSYIYSTSYGQKKGQESN